MTTLDFGEHLLALKVMRLTRPTLVNPYILRCESQDMPQDSFLNAQLAEGTITAGSDPLGAGQFMLLPQSFGNIYLGETFSSYICVHNCTTYAVEGVTIKADLQSNTTRISLPMHENKITPAILGPKDTLDDVIRYEVKEIGTHILVCEVNYLTPAGLPQSFRKFFKFQVLKPLDVKTKFYNAEMDEIYLEAQIQNITTGPFCLEKVELDPSEQYTVTSLNTLPNGESVFTSKNILQPNNSCKFLYFIKAKPEIARDIKTLRQATTVGKLDIVWRTNMGEKGRLQTSQLQRLPFEYKDVRLEVIDAKNIVLIGVPFTFTCRVTNMSEQDMDLDVELPNIPRPSSSFIGKAKIPIGALKPSQAYEFNLTVIPTRVGLVRIRPLIFSNQLNQQEYRIDKVVDIFVVEEDFREDEFDFNKFVRHDRASDRKQEASSANTLPNKVKDMTI